MEPSTQVLEMKPKDEESHLIAYIEKNYPMQWASPDKMFEMFINPETDKLFLEGKYLNAYRPKLLEKAYTDAKNFNKIINNEKTDKV